MFKKMFLALVIIASISVPAFAGNWMTPVADNAIPFPNANLMGVSMSTGTTTGKHPIQAGNTLLYDVFIVKTSTDVTGSVVLQTYTGATTVVTINIVGSLDKGRSHGILPLANAGIPIRLGTGLRLYTSTANIKAYALYR